MRVRVCVNPESIGLLGLILIWQQPVSAYLDPGSGSLIYQALLAALLGVGFTFRRLLGVFDRSRSRAVPPPTDAPAPDAASRHTAP